MINPGITFLSILAFIAVDCTSKITKEERNNNYLPVTKIVDGDTFYVDDGSEDGCKVRLIGVDAPESHRTSKEEIQYFGKESKNYLSEILAGKNVRLEYDIERHDQYNRTLAYVYLEDGTFINAELIKHGYAVIMTVPPNVKYSEYFMKLQKRARRKELGLWNNSSDPN